MPRDFTYESWRRRPDLNRGWRFCRPLPYHLATAPIGLGQVDPGEVPAFAKGFGASLVWLANRRSCTRAKDGAGNGIRTRDFDLGKVALYH